MFHSWKISASTAAIQLWCAESTETLKLKIVNVIDVWGANNTF